MRATTVQAPTAEEVRRCEAQIAFDQALVRARGRLSGSVREVEPNHYTVPSVSGETYNVYVVERSHTLRYECECPGSEFGWTCWHAALVAALPKQFLARAAMVAENHEFNQIFETSEMLPEIGQRFHKRKIPGYQVNFSPD